MLAGEVRRYDKFGDCIQKRSSISLAPHKSNMNHPQNPGLLFRPVLCLRLVAPLVGVVTPPGLEAYHLALDAVWILEGSCSVVLQS